MVALKDCRNRALYVLLTIFVLWTIVLVLQYVNPSGFFTPYLKYLDIVNKFVFSSAFAIVGVYSLNKYLQYKKSLKKEETKKESNEERAEVTVTDVDHDIMPTKKKVGFFSRKFGEDTINTAKP